MLFKSFFPFNAAMTYTAQWVVLGLILWIVQAVYGQLGVTPLRYECKFNRADATMDLVYETCLNDGWQTFSAQSNRERAATTDLVNLFRAFLTKQCDLFGTGKPEPANLRKFKYSCQLERAAAFECPEKDADFKSDDFFWRGRKTFEELRPNNGPRRALMWMLAPELKDTKISSTREFSSPQLDFYYFVYNYVATEIGCYQKECTVEGKKAEYVSCTTGSRYRREGPLYGTLKACEKDNDCHSIGHGPCDKELKLCEQTYVNCKLDVPGSTVQPCKQLFECSQGYVKRENIACASTVLIAVRNKDSDIYTVKAFGVAVSETHFLTSISSGMPKFEGHLYIITRGRQVRHFRKDGLYVEPHFGHFDLNAWADLLLVELPPSAGFRFMTTMVPETEQPNPIPGTPRTFVGSDTALDHLDKEFSLNDDSYCQKIFADDVFTYDPRHMACASDKTAKHTKFLSGAYVAVKQSMRDKYLLFGIRSLVPLNEKYAKDYLITKVGPHCNWLESVSNGKVKCEKRARVG